MSEKIQETNLMEQKNLRDQCADRVEVLDKVKALFLIPEMEAMTMKMVADFYEVDTITIRQCYTRNRQEILADGSEMKSYRDFLLLQHVTAEKQHYKAIIRLSDNITIEVPNCGVRVFSKRAVLRIGMLLRDSSIAKEVRTQLLNTFETTTSEQKIKPILDEQDLYMNLARAFIDGTREDLACAAQEVFEYKNRCINRMKRENQVLSGKILEWSDRASFNKAVRVIAGMIGREIPLVYHEIYDELRYRYNIGLSQRKEKHGGDGTYIDYIREEEWSILQKVLAALSRKYDIDFDEVVRRSKLKTE